MINKLSLISLVLGSFLLIINFLGLFQTLRPANIESEHLSFKERDVVLSYEDFVANINKQPQESNEAY